MVRLTRVLRMWYLPGLAAVMALALLFAGPHGKTTTPAEAANWELRLAKNPSNGHYYMLTPYWLNWWEAEQMARGLGGHLVTINDRAEELWLQGQFGLGYFWTGFNDLALEGSWGWVSGEPVTYTNWCQGEPNNYTGVSPSGENAALMNQSPTSDCWNDIPEILSAPGIVETTRIPSVLLVLVNAEFSGTEEVVGLLFSSGTQVTLEVDNGADGSVDYSETQTVDALGTVRFSADGKFAVGEGDIVRLSDDQAPPLEKQHRVDYLALASVDPLTDTVTGRARPGTEVEAVIFDPALLPELGGPEVTGTADPCGTWSASFAGVSDIVTGSTGWVQTTDQDRDHTTILWEAPIGLGPMYDPLWNDQVTKDFNTEDPNRRRHEGIDYWWPDIDNDPVFPVATGEVIRVWDVVTSSAGKWVWVYHGDVLDRNGNVVSNVSTRYLHLDSINVEVGDIVRDVISSGRTIVGHVGGSGGHKPHLHLEVRQGDCPTGDYRDTTPLDPAEFLEHRLWDSSKPRGLAVRADSPVDLVLVDPDGFAISKETNELPGVGGYLEVSGHETAPGYDFIGIEERKVGDYLITVTPEPGAQPTDTYTLVASAGDTRIVLAADAPVGEIPPVPYVITSTETGISPLDARSPTTTISLAPGLPDGANGWYVSPVTVTLSAEDDPGGSGVASTEYRLNGGTWQPYAGSFTLSDDGTTTVEARSTDNAGNVEDPPVAATVHIDQTAPTLTIEVPAIGEAVQDGITLVAGVGDPTSAVADCHFYLREDTGGGGTPVGFEDLPATYDPATGKCEYYFDSTQLPDGYYIVLAKAMDSAGNEGWSTPRQFSIRNWAVLELLPASKNNKAGRTMPVKFSLRIAAAVDPAQPFVRNEELTIKIFETGHPGDVLQESTYGDTARDYRIDGGGELYITNFKTLKRPKNYTVEIWRKDFLVGSFTFATVK